MFVGKAVVDSGSVSTAKKQIQDFSMRIQPSVNVVNIVVLDLKKSEN